MAQKSKKEYRSLLEIEQEFLPNIYKEKVKKSKTPRNYGRILAVELIESIKKEIM